MVHLDRDAGLTDVLTGKIDWRKAIRPVISCPNLFVLGSGHASPLALTLIESRMRDVLAHAANEFELVILDSSPLLGCSETLDLAAASDVTLVTARSGHTPMKALGATVDTLRPASMWRSQASC